jgi:DNA modification methylase
MRKEVIGNATLYLGDCLEVLPTLPKVDAIITDPPYSSGGYQESGGATGSIGSTIVHTIAADNLSTRGYLRLITRVARATHAREIYIFCDWRMWTYTMDAIEDGFFRIRSMIVWNKGHPGMGVGWRGQHELIAYGLRGPAKFGPGKGNVLNISRSNNADHPTQKPVALMAELMKGTDAEMIVDPFMGSGTTGVACIDLGRKFTGIEIEPKYFDSACERIENAQRQTRMFA